ncbi:MAG: hypothetical protein V3U35_04320 [Candidatus Neomarinimicrobiota bacterium]
MSQQSSHDFDGLIRAAQVDLPPGLKARLLAIPRTAVPVSFWDLRWMLPAAALGPAAGWFIITRAGTLTESMATKLTVLFGRLALPALPAAPLLAVGTALAAVALALGLGTWLYLRSEQRHDLLYIRRLTGAF